MNEILSREFISTYLRYDQIIGAVHWIKSTSSRGPRKVGLVAGSLDKSNGYLKVGFCGHRLYIHRIAWLLYYGYWPLYIDHINGNKLDNRLLNLRGVNMSQNISNADYGKYRGIESHGAMFRVRLVSKGIRHEFGSYSSIEEAHQVSIEAQNKLYGEYSIHQRSL